MVVALFPSGGSTPHRPQRFPYIPSVPMRRPKAPTKRSHPPPSPCDPLVEEHLRALAATSGRSGRATLRKEQGSHYTPPALVAWILDQAMGRRGRPLRVLDPACGAGNFLVAVATRLIMGGDSAADVLSERVHGVDIDVRAVELCRARLLELLPSDAPAAERAAVARALEAHVVVDDPLDRGIAAVGRGGSFDLIVGNPPFLNQLEAATTASRERAERIRARTGGAVAGYADLSAAFLLDACASVAPGGIVGFVMPQSFLAAADAHAARAALAGSMAVRALWTADEHLFDGAGVRVAAIVAERPPRPSPRRDDARVERAFGASFEALEPVECASLERGTPWSALFADARGVPAVRVDARATIATVAAVTADFRDQFYGLRGAIVDAADADESRFPRLVSTRHVDLARCRWGEVPARILFERFAAPRADRAALERDPSMAAWMRARLVPKVLVATQTRVMEAVVDEQGAWLPVVPLLTATLRPQADIDLWMLAAAVASPVVTAEAARVSYGVALSAGAIKLSARQLLAMPLPSVREEWTASATALRDASMSVESPIREAHLRAFAAASCRAYRLGGTAAAEVLGFWERRAGIGS